MIDRILFALAILIAGFVGGYAWRGDREATKVSAAQASESACRAALDSQTTALADVRETLADVRERHERALRDAGIVLASRDAEIEALAQDVDALTKALKEAAHDDALCAPLGRIAVCSAVARQLWPAATGAGGDRHAR